MALQDISFECKSGCRDCCGLVLFTKKEVLAASNIFPMVSWSPFGHKAWVPTGAIESLTCPFITDAGCGIYDVRPAICKLFGAVDSPLLMCPHGCGPRVKLTDSEAKDFIRAES